MAAMKRIGDDATLSRDDYRRLVERAETYRKALIVRLLGESGLRVAEITRLRPEDLRPAPGDSSGALLDVRTAEGERSRVAYVSADLRRALDRYVRSDGIADDEPVIGVSARRVQMLVSEAADEAGADRLSEVSASDLRSYFARTLLVEETVDPRVVLAAGGWESLSSFDRLLDAPGEAAIADALAGADHGPAAAGSGSASSDRSSQSPARATEFDAGIARSLLADSAARALVRLDPDGYVERWLDGADGEERDDLSGRHLSTVYADDGRSRDHLDAAAESGGHEAEGWRFDADGERFWARTVLATHREDSQLSGYTMVLWDHTDRKRREDELRERAERLDRRRNVRKRIRSADEAVLATSDRDDLEAAVCDRLVDGEEYAFAWTATSDLVAEQSSPTARAGIEQDDIDALIERLDGESPPWIEAMRDDAVCTAELDADPAELNDAPIAAGIDALAAVPLSHRETTYGVLVVGTDRGTPDDWERTELAELGRRIGHAVTAIQRRTLLLSDAVVELEFWCRDEAAFFVDASDRLDCTFRLESIVPVSASSLLFYVAVEDAPPADVFDHAVEHRGVEEVRLVETHDDGALLEFVVGGDSPLLTLTAYGATISEAVIESGEARLLAEVAQDADLRAVVEGVRTAFPDTELVGKHDVERPVRTVREFREGIDDELTDRQEATLRAAYYAGYFDWPRGSTAEEVADSMGVSSPTLHNHLRKGQRALLATFLEGSVGGE
ncbi:hypothetical protein SAMN06269185_0238 [Natronoarchaeum philippinense]|uniref:PAS domain S-box-containing protein n=1 Tax=Natronoarchaeum philippinense TaxID=558529 RepID=A0A285N383_NATPI|nr:bacterio-opsin activator domain-containing protein [Natronoarchaeum philippinense]SNZ03287.1 hypothetical protein SAMN06269185_0238 [Natronoarchaeum philippinense]